MQPVLVAAPGSSSFAPPVSFDYLSGVLVKTHRRMAAVGVGGWTALTGFALGLFLLTHSKQAGGYAVVLGLMALAMGIDSFRALRDANGLAERALFFFWLQSARSFKVGLVVWVTVLLAAGAIQIVLQEKLGGFEPLIESYGAVYSRITNGQLWRLVSGPFFHSDLPHYLANAALALFIGPLAWALFGPATCSLFLVGSVAGVAIQMQFGSTIYDSYVGMSAGIFALFGFVVASSVFERKLLPIGFGLICAWIALISTVGTELISAGAATAAHIAGFATGSVCTVAHVGIRQLKGNFS